MHCAWNHTGKIGLVACTKLIATVVWQGVEIDGKMLSRLSEAYVASWGKAGIFAVQSSWTLVQRAKCGDALLKGVEVGLCVL